MFEQMLKTGNAPFLVAAAIILVVAFAVTRLMAATEGGRGALERFNTCDRGLRRATIILGIAYFVIYSWLSIQRYNKFLCGTWDLGIFSSLFNNTLSGRFYQDYRGPFDHFQPIGVVYLAFYAVWHDVRLLLVLQSAAMAAAAWPLYLLVREVSGKATVAAVVSMAYLLYPFLGCGNLYDFHILSLSPFFFFSMLLFMVRRRWVWYAVAMLALLCVKQSEAILVVGAGMYLVSRRDYAAGALTCAAAVGWGFLSVYLFMPMFTGKIFGHMDRYQGLAEIAKWGLTTPVGKATTIFYILRVFEVTAFVLAPLGFLALRNWPAALFIIGPMLGANLISKTPFQNVLFGHYGITATSAVLGAAALATAGMSGLEKGERPARWPVFLLVTAALSNLVLSYPANERWAFPSAYLEMGKSWNVMSAPVPFNRARLEFYSVDPAEKAMVAVRDCFPKDATIAAQNNLGYHVADRNRLLDLSEDVTADYYLLNPSRDDFFTGRRTVGALLKRLSENPDMHAFLIMGGPDGATPELAFYASTARALEFYTNVRRALERDPSDEGLTLALAAMEKNMGMPPSRGR